LGPRLLGSAVQAQEHICVYSEQAFLPVLLEQILARGRPTWKQLAHRCVLSHRRQLRTAELTAVRLCPSYGGKRRTAALDGLLDRQRPFHPCLAVTRDRAE